MPLTERGIGMSTKRTNEHARKRAGEGPVIEITAGACGFVQGLSILQYANHAGLDFVSSNSDMDPSLWPCCLEAGDSIAARKRI